MGSHPREVAWQGVSRGLRPVLRLGLALSPAPTGHTQVASLRMYVRARVSDQAGGLRWGRISRGSLVLQPRRQRTGCGELGLPANGAGSAERPLEEAGLGT